MKKRLASDTTPAWARICASWCGPVRGGTTNVRAPWPKGAAANRRSSYRRHATTPSTARTARANTHRTARFIASIVSSLREPGLGLLQLFLLVLPAPVQLVQLSLCVPVGIDQRCGLRGVGEHTGIGELCFGGLLLLLDLRDALFESGDLLLQRTQRLRAFL